MKVNHEKLIYLTKEKINTGIKQLHFIFLAPIIKYLRRFTMFDYFVYDATIEQKAAVDKAMNTITRAGILSNYPNIEIDIEFVSTPGGGCIDMEDGNFTIEVNKRLVTKSIIKTVLHEMIHVKQYAEGRLTQNEWEGKPHPKLPYRELPWEIEAYKMEDELYGN